MFCSKCGKTLAPDIEKCLYCGNAVGESRFDGTPYTSAQRHLIPGEKYSFVADFKGDSQKPEAAETPAENGAEAAEAVAEVQEEAPAVPMWEAPEYTRTTYTSLPDDTADKADVDSRTTYRPSFDVTASLDEMKRDMRAVLTGPETEEEAPEYEPASSEPEYLSDEAISTLNAVYAELEMDELSAPDIEFQPIRSEGRAGISSDVADYIQQLEANKQRRSLRRKRVYEEDLEEYTAPEEEAPYEEPEEVDPEIDTEQSEVFEDINEE